MRWIIGDIHGMLLPLEALLTLIDRRDPDARLLFVGDYVNRGPESRRVVDLLLTLRDHAFFVRGNHDDVFDLILHGTAYCHHAGPPDPIAAFHWFMNHGLADTLLSYGADAAILEHVWAHPTPERLAEILSNVPAAHREFFRGLQPVIEQPDLFVAHAMWDPDDSDISPSITEQLRGRNAGPLKFKILWGRYSADEVQRKKRWRRTGFFGHTPVQSYATHEAKNGNVPMRGPKAILLDTGAGASTAGRLSAVCAESGECLQVDRSGVPVQAEAT